MYALIKKAMAAAGHEVSEGETWGAAEIVKFRDYAHFELGVAADDAHGIYTFPEHFRAAWERIAGHAGVSAPEATATAIAAAADANAKAAAETAPVASVSAPAVSGLPSAPADTPSAAAEQAAAAAQSLPSAPAPAADAADQLGIAAQQEAARPTPAPVKTAPNDTPSGMSMDVSAKKE